MTEIITNSRVLTTQLYKMLTSALVLDFNIKHRKLTSLLMPLLPPS